VAVNGKDNHKQQYVASVILGLVEVVSGNASAGLDLIEQAATEHQFWTIFLVRSPLFKSFLAGPRYNTLLGKMNLA